MIDKKILCIGNETEQSDHIVTTLATNAYSINHGLISSPDFTPMAAGYYHTSIADIPAGAIAQQVAEKFDQIIMLDQDVELYPHFKSFVNTFRLMIELERAQFDTKFRDNICNKNIIYWYDLFHTNKSMCVYPFIGLQNNFGWATLCQKNPIELTKLESIVDWQTAPGFTSVRNNMLDGIKMPNNCDACYEREESNGESARQFESLEWFIRLKLTKLEDLKKITHPVYIEVRPNNKCNIMCRMCDDRYSDLIEKENKKILTEETIKKFTSSPTRESFVTTNSKVSQLAYVKGFQPEMEQSFIKVQEFEAIEKAATEQILSQKMNVMVHGNSRIHAGDTVNLTFPDSTVTEKGKRKDNDDTTGKYLVTAVVHRINVTHKYVTIMECVKDVSRVQPKPEDE